MNKATVDISILILITTVKYYPNIKTKILVLVGILYVEEWYYTCLVFILSKHKYMLILLLLANLKFQKWLSLVY